MSRDADRAGTERNKAVARRFLEAFNDGNLDVLDELYVENYLHHNDAFYPDLKPGLSGFKHALRTHGGGFSDVRIHIDDLIAERDRVVARFRVHAKHTAEFRGVPATGRVVTFTAIDIYRFEEGRIAEGWAVIDFLGIMQQLGAEKPP